MSKLILELVLGASLLFPGAESFSSVAGNAGRARGVERLIASRHTDPVSQGIRTLAVGTPISGQLRAGESILLSIEVSAPNQYLQLTIKQGSIDIGAVLRLRDGQLLASTTAGGQLRQKSLLLRVASPGTYQLQLRPLNTSSVGCYEARIESLRPFTSGDNARIAAYDAFEAAERNRTRLKKSALQQAVKDYNQALGLWQQPNDKLETVRTLNGLGEVYINLGEQKKALDAYQQSLSLSRPAAYVREEAVAVNGLGVLNIYQNKFDEGIDYLSNKALPLWLQVGDRSGALETLANLVYICGALNKTAEAQGYSKQGMALIDETCDRYDKAPLLNNIGRLHYDQGEYTRAAEYYLPAQEIFHEMGAEDYEAGVLLNLGTCYYNMGENQRALDYDTRALPLLEGTTEAFTLGTLLNNIGTIHFSLGDDRAALRFYQQALPLWRKPRQPRGLAQSFELIGNTYWQLGRQAIALSYLHRARLLFREIKQPGSEANTMADIAEVLLSNGQKNRALSYLLRARPLAQGRDPQAEAYILRTLGKVHAAMGQTDLALSEYKEGLAITHRIKELQEEATLCHKIAQLEQSRGHLTIAHSYLQDALRLVESIRGNVNSHNLRAFFLASKQDIYNTDIDVLMQLHLQESGAGHDAEALYVSERSRARSLLDLLNEAHADLSQGIKPELLERRRRLQQEITAKATLRSELVRNEPTNARLSQLDSETDSLIDDVNVLEDRIKAESPRYAALALPQSLNSEEIRAKVLDSKTLLLEYKLGAKRSFLWLVAKDKVQSYILPRRDVIEGLARKTYRSLTERTHTEPAETYLKRVKRQDAAFYVHALALADMVLGPVAANLDGKRLLVVSDGALEYIPFAALPLPGSSSPSGVTRVPPEMCQGSPYCPSVVTHEIVSVPSASTVHILREEAKRHSEPTKTIAVFAQPIFVSPVKPAAPAQIARATNSSRAPIHDIARPLSRVGSGRRGERGELLDPLPHAGREAALIASLVPGDSCLIASGDEDEVPVANCHIARGYEVNHKATTSSTLMDYRFIHFATHSLIDNERPELSAIFLSLWDRQGRFQNNGILRLGEVYNLQLSAEAVVLSACETALGQQLNGEGFIGLTRGFMYAGASCVVASLWLVSDQSTADLMGMFYEPALGKEQMPTTAALRTAQARFWHKAKGTEKSFPYFWAAFIAQGLYSKADN